MRAVILCVVLLTGCASTSRVAATPPTAPALRLNVVLDGNSLSIAVNGVPSYGDYLPVSVTNCASGGQTTREMLAEPTDVDAAFDRNARNVLIAWEGTNDLYFGASPDQAVERLLAYRERMTARGWTVILLTLLPRQSTPDPPSFEIQRLAVNAGLRAAGGLLIDVGNDPQIGAFQSVTAGTFYQPDKVHLTDAGARRIAELVSPALHRYLKR